MIHVTEAAVALLEQSRHDQQIPRSHGVRIYEQADHGDGPRLRLAVTFVAHPEKGDRRFEEHGTRFYVAPEMVLPLEDVIIDVTDPDWPHLELREIRATG
jgi:Fe-S cluster assembly iron-binding protein IscA